MKLYLAGPLFTQAEQNWLRNLKSEIASLANDVDVVWPGDLVSEEDIKKWIRGTITSGQDDNLFELCIDRFGSMLISEALKLAGGNRSKAARLLGLSRPTLHAKIEKYGLKLETNVRPD